MLLFKKQDKRAKKTGKIRKLINKIPGNVITYVFFVLASACTILNFKLIITGGSITDWPLENIIRFLLVQFVLCIVLYASIKQIATYYMKH